mmetsp:Transcript_34988/g.62909  ORF Transcript_34988/g.62909 Transcript_34988/m.62909 type:complete len:389 (-) Transcript_34988:967-2133(-)|eukprot:CAMPEP_0175070362 /NCGR_PEP_ID=MMETSP0052_2-20121109/18677_1 /TAXON_ID=51329 ORGANISM="Polytomella parva, Strain SAG 63-3" /NCGR_SAMPLE_ID=MMETSP0052_2 /ASSEMBLY_ACC=CAM_ASM_000194 /LENGTH=388 /DNA_ID=CAMNT_0016337477 /DNA_START=155 /DNA_END=1321 /DNA_ORIENTATION=+
MQSHASRRVVSEFLADLHPDLSPPFVKGVIRTEIADAYGRRAIPKLITFLGLNAEIGDEDITHALRVFNGLLSTQEHKTNAVIEGAAPTLLALVATRSSMEARSLSCEALASLAQVAPGRRSIAESGGLDGLTDALSTTPEAAAKVFRLFASCYDGVNLLGPTLPRAVPALVLLCTTPSDEGVSLKACEHAAAALAGICINDEGALVSLDSQLPRCLIALAKRGLVGEFRFESELMAMLEQLSLCLARVCHHPYGKTQVREAEPFEVIKMMLTLQHRGVVRNTVAALMGMSIEKESKEPIMLYCGLMLVALLKQKGDSEMVLNARSALQHCCEDLNARKMLDMLPMNPEEKLATLYQAEQEPSAPPDYWYEVKLPQPTINTVYEMRRD